MIFRPELAKLIVRGKKTATRRPVKPDERECRYRPGHDYAIQPGRGKPAIARLLVLNVEEQFVGDITFDQARAEGFRTTADFAHYWMTLHSKTYTDDHRSTSDERTLQQFHARYGERRVWAITFEIDRQHHPLYLTPASRPAGTEHGYTTDPRAALPDEPEVVDVDTLRPAWRDEADARHADAAGDLATRVERARDLAASRGIDVRHLEKALDQRVRALERKARAA